jgi:hypothetical protein
MKKATYINDHGCGSNRECIIGVLEKGVLGGEEVGKIFVALHEDIGRYYSINMIYIGDDDKLHLSRLSVAGVIRNATRPVEEQLTEYNNMKLIPGITPRYLRLATDEEAEAFLAGEYNELPAYAC